MLPVVQNETGKKGRKKEPELPVYQGRGGEWRLTTAERKRILLNNIYGVDIDRQAVEVTKLSLLLKVLEGEDEQSVGQLKLFHEGVLPDLGRNIKCGNSLIGPDFFRGGQTSLLAEEDPTRINPFDWEAAPLVVAGGRRKNVSQTFQMVRDSMDVGAMGVAMGRNLWGGEDPVKMIKAVCALVHHQAGVHDALDMLK